MKKKPIRIATFQIPKTRKGRILVSSSIFAQGAIMNPKALEDLHTAACIAEQLVAQARGFA